MLNHLATEIMMLKEFLPTVCEAGVNNAPGVAMQLTRTEKGMEIQQNDYHAPVIYTIRSFE